MLTLTRPVSSVKTALRPLMMTSVELVSRDRDYAESIDLGRDYIKSV